MALILMTLMMIYFENNDDTVITVVQEQDLLMIIMDEGQLNEIPTKKVKKSKINWPVGPDVRPPSLSMEYTIILK